MAAPEYAKVTRSPALSDVSSLSGKSAQSSGLQQVSGFQFFKKSTALGNVTINLSYDIEGRKGEKTEVIPAVDNVVARIKDSFGKVFELSPDNDGNISFQDKVTKKPRTYQMEIFHKTGVDEKGNNKLSCELEKVKAVVNKVDKIVKLNFDNKTEAPNASVKLSFNFQPLDVSIMGPLPADELPRWDTLKEFAFKLFPLIGDFILSTITSFAGKLAALFGVESWTTAKVQEIFDDSQKEYVLGPDGKRVEQPKYPVIPATSENLIDLLLNKVSAVPYEIDEANNKVRWVCNWDKYKQDTPDSLANIVVTATLPPKGEDGKWIGSPVFEDISIGFGAEEPVTIKQGITTYAKMDAQETQEWAIRYAISMFTTLGEASEHLARGHLVTGIFEQAFDKAIGWSNPLKKILDPHYEGTTAINKLGSLGIIFGDKSILELGGLDKDGLKDLIIEKMGVAGDWKNYKPRTPIGDEKSHFLAYAEADCYNGLLEVFGNIIDKEWDEIKKPQNWVQIWRWSWLTHHQFPAIPEFISGRTAPAEGDRENLKKVLAYNLTLVFLHHMAHTSQEAATSIYSGWLSPQNRALTPEGKFARDGNTPPNAAIRQNLISRFLMDFKGDVITDTKFAVNPQIRAFFGDFLAKLAVYYPKAREMMKSVQI